MEFWILIDWLISKCTVYKSNGQANLLIKNSINKEKFKIKIINDGDIRQIFGGSYIYGMTDWLIDYILFVIFSNPNQAAEFIKFTSFIKLIEFTVY